ncbi:hypothetical protein MS3_00009384 [Schistosoma haematobium]|uniref:Uncharacterized protein n=1 Tax=Schistosoma haematobium TaxID=6185 RepID=A0A6A5EBP6_SCHHA|nr:hypothetical protein MS3_00009384 [Schistosoma haematobium]KAH9580896.1 hypothetical protein MS3_00009384 [Schistosoma haematobium]
MEPKFAFQIYNSDAEVIVIYSDAYCQKYNTTETCRNASSKNITCFWCEKANRCIDSNDQDTHDLKVINCRVEKILDVINPSTTPPNHIETTLEITDVQVRENLNDTVEETERYSNITTDITEKNQQNELLWYIYIVIPLAVFFFVVCIGYIIRRRLHRRKRSNE